MDNFTLESMAIEVGASLTGRHVVEVLRRLGRVGRKPRWITADNGTEFISKALDRWAHWHKVQLDFIRPGKPTENAFIESFNGRFRQECLNAHWFQSLEEARQAIEGWRWQYNVERPHSGLNGQTPEESLRRLASTGPGGKAEILTL